MIRHSKNADLLFKISIVSEELDDDGTLVRIHYPYYEFVTSLIDLPLHKYVASDELYKIQSKLTSDVISKLT